MDKHGLKTDHDLADHFVREVCDSALVLQNGRAQHYSDIDEALGVYATL